MRNGVVALAIVLVTSLPGGEGPTPEDVRFCSWVRTHWLDEDEGHAVLVVATGDWRSAYHVDLPFYEPPPSDPDTLVMALTLEDSVMYRFQRFTVLMSGAGHGLEPETDLWVSPMTGCMPSRPGQSEEWVPVGDTVTFVLDPQYGWTGPEGGRLFTANTHFNPLPGSGQSGRRPELSGSEYFAFLRALPTPDAMESNPRAALETLESWVVANVDSTAYPVGSALADFREERERRSIFWEGHPYLVGCYGLEWASELGHSTLGSLERVVYLSDVPVRPGFFGTVPHYVVRAAPGQVASGFTSVTWFAVEGSLSLVWRGEDELVHATFDADHSTMARSFEGEFEVFLRERRSYSGETRAFLTKVPCDPSMREGCSDRLCTGL